MNHRKHIESTFLVIGRFRLAEMLLSTRIQLSADRGQTVQKRFLMRSLKLLGKSLKMSKDAKERDPKDYDMIETQRLKDPPPKKFLRREDQRGLMNLFKMQRNMVPKWVS